MIQNVEVAELSNRVKIFTVYQLFQLTFYLAKICIMHIVDDGIKDNILYVSAGPKVDENPKAAVYASDNKRGPESNNNANVYAEVNKSGRIIAEEGALYSDVKPKRGIQLV